MKRLGKLLLLAVLSVSALNGATLTKIFDLNEQEFASLSYDKIKKYKINNIILGINLKKINENQNSYMRRVGNMNNDGHLSLNIIDKKDLKHWLLKIDMNLGADDTANRRIVFTDETGNSFFISFIGQGNIYFNDESLIKLKSKRYSFEYRLINNKFTFLIDGKKIFRDEVIFGNLKKVEFGLHDEPKQKFSDAIYNLVLQQVTK